ncbi:hypothetical protein PRIPAC_74144 [Pristionchus pacificus]|uniref:Uncharacterized protein n=1 Tax=Pristionchus pacificus TaxID=54126 RepID=A0A2A6BG61_PRIPA|nr:hypothetical protein PRIPAC_74144 [Pristionchus pacificus]|eukprot:PDM64863.1 hypothetical protein PRIPAC_53119 [Pristionchus pacificus]
MASSPKRLRPNDEGCCPIVTGQINTTTFERPMTISEEDLLSNINDDCLREIFPYFDHDELDEISLVSQRLNLFTLTARKTAMRKRTRENSRLILHRSDRGTTSLIGIGIDDCYWLTSLDNDEILKFDRSPRPTIIWNSRSTTQSKPTQTPCEIFKRMNFLLERYQFSWIKIDWVLINNSFVDHCERIFDFRSPPRLSFLETTFDSDMQSVSMKRFTDWILSMNLENVSFKNTKIGQTGAIDANFLVRFSQNGENLKLIVEDREAVSSNALIFVDRDMIDSLVKYSELNINYNIVVDTEWVMDLIKARFRRNVSGNWGISTTRKLREDELIASLDADMRLEEEDADQYRISLNDEQNSSNFLIVLFREEEFTKIDIEFDVDGDSDDSN